jgi:vacuolar-type H+-ATPase subunit D/Vma8
MQQAQDPSKALAAGFRFDMTSHDGPPRSDDVITIMSHSDMIWALVDEHRQVKHRVAHLENDVVPQLIHCARVVA